MFKLLLTVFFVAGAVLLCNSNLQPGDDIIAIKNVLDEVQFENLPHLNENSKCTGENFTICFDNLIEYIRMGQNDIEITNGTDIIIVVGLSGVGKSTIVQFIANVTNPLEAVCRGTKCNITDESGAIGSNIISQTFIPNLVVDNITNNLVTPFYDMPGFNDNRNETVEIANSFFVKRVLENARRVKIVAVVRKEDLSLSDKLRFPMLLDNFCKLVKDPAKFDNGISIIANMAGYNDDEVDIFIDYYDFMNDVNSSLPGLVKPEHLNAAEKLMAIFMREKPNDQREPVPANLGIMRTPRYNGSIRTDEIFQRDYLKLKSLIHNSTEYIDKIDSDFGFAISSDAELFLVKAAAATATSVKQVFARMADDIIEIISEGFEKLANEGSAYVGFEDDLVNLSTASYSFINDTGVKPTEYLNAIFATVLTFTDDETISPCRKELNTTFIFLDYAFQVLPNIELYQQTWIEPLHDIQIKIIKNSKTEDALMKFLENFQLQFQTLTADYALQSVIRINEHSAINAKIVELSKLLSSAATLESNFSSLKLSSYYLSEYIRNVTQEYENLNNVAAAFDIDYPFLELIECFFQSSFAWKTIEWVSVHTHLFKDLVNEETTFTNELINLQTDLSSTEVQSFREQGLHSWWQSDSQITELIINDFWNRANSLKFSISKAYSKEKLWSVLNAENTLGRKNRMADLLNIKLSGQPGCEESNGSTLLYIGTSISLKHLPNCTLNTVTNVVVLALDELYFDSDITGNLYNPTNNINYLAIAPTWNIVGQSQFNLVGIDAAKGFPGGPAGNFYGIYLDKLGSPGPGFILNGGRGGAGQDGEAGINGIVGQKKEFNVNTDCKAWLFGSGIQIQIVPNSCNTCLDDSKLCQCPAGNCGVTVEIYGSKGNNGTRGGNGADGKPGGIAGDAVLVDLRARAPTVINGTVGLGGEGGRKGPGGKGGRDGETLLVTVDDFLRSFKKVCEIVDDASRYLNPFVHSDGPDGQEGNRGQGTNGSKMAIDKKLYVDLLKNKIAFLQGNEYLHGKLNEFLEMMQKNNYVPQTVNYFAHHALSD